ncbi:MAG: large subunit ribosomal protein [Bacillota bacterium]|nr:large subunit ribosomal protein [Bacillota bacterium]MDK2924546.1 large subunit ribosomal protein [Bacillota bacterium]
MDLSTLSPAPGSRPAKTRVGRGIGSGLGKTSGRGHKGQKARSGGGKGPAFEGGQKPLHLRLPKRGFKNPFRVEYSVVNLAALEEKFAPGDEVTPESLCAAGLIKRAGEKVKVLGDGELTKPLTVRANAFSKTAEQKILAAGGKAEVI